MVLKKPYYLEDTIILSGLGGGLGMKNFGNLKYTTRVHSWVRTDGRTEKIAISLSLFRKCVGIIASIVMIDTFQSESNYFKKSIECCLLNSSMSL